MFLICVVAFLALLTFQSVEGCTCLRDSLTDLFKASDFVFIGKLVNKTAENTINGEPDPNADTNYVVQVLTIYEGSYLVSGTELVYLRTPGIFSLCGVDLDVDQVYIFNGRKTVSREGVPTLTITECGMVFHSPVTPEIVRFLEGALAPKKFTA